MEAPGFWDDPDRSNRQMKELKQLKDTVAQCNGLKSQYEDIETLIEMGYEAEDAEMIPEIREELDRFIEAFETLRISTLLSEEYDKCNAILKLNAGAGGTESCDWAGMLYRMYTRWAERRGFSIDVLDFLDGDEAGIKSITFQVNGENAYGYLKSEKGVHRLVRISPFNAQASGRLLSCHWMSCRISRKIWTWRSTRMTCGLTHTEAAAQEASISTRPPPQSVSRTFRLEPLSSVRMSAHSSRIKIRRCRC